MPEWIVTYKADLPVTADTAQEASTRDPGSGCWIAYPCHPDRPDAYDIDAQVEEGDAGLPELIATIGPVGLAAYQDRDEADQPKPVLIIDVDIDNPSDAEVRVYVNDRLTT